MERRIGRCLYAPRHTRFLVAVQLALAGLAFAPPVALTGQTSSFGPLWSEEASPIHRLGHTPMSEGADPVEARTFQVDVWSGFSNIFEQDSADTHEVFIDMERLATAVVARYGLGNGLEIGGRVSLETTGGGILDAFITDWHDRLGLGNANRGRYPFGDHEVRLAVDDEVLLQADSRTLAVEDVRIFAKWRMLSSESGANALSLRTIARFPVNPGRTHRDRADASMLALGRLQAGAWFGHIQAGATRLGASPSYDVFLNRTTWFTLLGVERPLGDRWSAIVQYQRTTSLLRGIDDTELDGTAANLVFGVAGRFGEAWLWEASFQEDLPADTPAVDFTLGIRVSRRW